MGPITKPDGAARNGEGRLAVDPRRQPAAAEAEAEELLLVVGKPEAAAEVAAVLALLPMRILLHTDERPLDLDSAARLKAIVIAGQSGLLGPLLERLDRLKTLSVPRFAVLPGCADPLLVQTCLARGVGICCTWPDDGDDLPRLVAYGLQAGLHRPHRGGFLFADAIRLRLAAEPDLARDPVRIRDLGGALHIEGRLSRPWKRDFLQAVVLGIPGMSAAGPVSFDLEAPEDNGDELCRVVIDHLGLEEGVAAETLLVDVDEELVILHGVVAENAQLQPALEQIGQLIGRQVEPLLIEAPEFEASCRVRAAALREGIMALYPQVELSVSVCGGIVELIGQMPSPEVSRSIEDRCHDHHGIRYVLNPSRPRPRVP